MKKDKETKDVLNIVNNEEFVQDDFETLPVEDRILAQADYIFQLVKDLKFVETLDDYKYKKKEMSVAISDYYKYLDEKFIL